MMSFSLVVSNRIGILPRTDSTSSLSSSLLRSISRVSYNHRGSFSIHLAISSNSETSSVHLDSLKLLEWDKVCDIVASFAATSRGKEATKAQLWTIAGTYEESLDLLKETDAAVGMHYHGGCRLFFTGLHLDLVDYAIRSARRKFPLGGDEAVAVAAMLETADTLQTNLKSAVKQDSEWFNRFMPLSQVIMELHTNRKFAKNIRQVVDDDGKVKDSASPAVKRGRDQVRILENRLNQLMDSIIRKQARDASLLEVKNFGGRWCIQSQGTQKMQLDCLLLSSDSSKGSTVEPLVAIPINDELQQAMASVLKAETEVLMKLTENMLEDIDEIEKLLNTIIHLDAINARATYSISYGGVHPALYFPENMDSTSEWALFMPKSYHPLLLHQYRTKIKRLKNKEAIPHPVAVDFEIGIKTKVLIITGPNTGGKTICLKTIGLSAMMAKSGLYVLSSESIRIPWFDAVYADIGDEQSLSQSLSTFSGHLKQISKIRSQSSQLSLVLLDEVGAGTNPLEGAALGMAVLESFASSGAFITIATTHHGELKSLKYSNDAFENACMEFDEVNLKPTFKILWGVPGRSNAINISERLGLPKPILNHAREIYGSASAELDQVIFDMERSKQDFRKLFHASRQYLKICRKLHEDIEKSEKKISDHKRSLNYRKGRAISEIASSARSLVHKRVREHRSIDSVSVKNSEKFDENDKELDGESLNQSHYKAVTERRISYPKVGEEVEIGSLGRKGTVLFIDKSKDEIFVQANFLKVKVKLADLVTRRR